MSEPTEEIGRGGSNRSNRCQFEVAQVKQQQRVHLDQFPHCVHILALGDIPRIDTRYEPHCRWGQKTGILCVWASCEDGRKVLVSLSTTNSESDESCVEVLRGLVKRGMRTPVTITTDGALGLTKAIDTK